MEFIRKYFVMGLVVSLLLGVIFAFLGVYSTNSLPFYKRYVFWTATMLTGYFSIAFAGPWTFYRLLPNQHRVIQLSVVILCISIPIAFVIAAFEINTHDLWDMNSWILRYIYVCVISSIVVSISYLVAQNRGWFNEHSNQNEEPNNNGIQVFAHRLPEKFKAAQLYAVSSEDHYVRVHTSVGETLILMRLSDALKGLSKVDGMQIHRSWWVATNAVASTLKQQGKHSLVLVSGKQVPVSRTYSKAIQNFGLKS